MPKGYTLPEPLAGAVLELIQRYAASGGVDLSAYATNAALSSAIGSRIPTGGLKTINGIAVEGSGDIAIAGVGDVTLAGVQTVTNKTLGAGTAFSQQPTGLIKATVGLGNVDNTADTAKPVSTAQQTAIDAKVADNLTASTTVAPSKTAVNSALATKQNVITDGTISGSPTLTTANHNRLNVYTGAAGTPNLGTVVNGAKIGIIHTGTGNLVVAGADTPASGYTNTVKPKETMWWTGVGGVWVGGNINTANLSVTPITVTGLTPVGSTLTRNVATGWATTGNWTRNGANISGATGSTYVTQVADAGTTVTFATAYYVAQGIVVDAAPPAGRTDTFNRNGANLGTPSDGGSAYLSSADFTTVAANGGYALLDDANAAGQFGQGVLETGLTNLVASIKFAVDYNFASAKEGFQNGFYADCRLWLRYVDANNYTEAILDSYGGLKLNKKIAGVETQVAFTGNIYDVVGLGDNFTLEYSITGQNLSARIYKNGAWQTALTGTLGAGELTSGTKIAIASYQDTGTTIRHCLYDLVVTP